MALLQHVVGALLTPAPCRSRNSSSLKTLPNSSRRAVGRAHPRLPSVCLRLSSTGLTSTANGLGAFFLCTRSRRSIRLRLVIRKMEELLLDCPFATVVVEVSLERIIAFTFPVVALIRCALSLEERSLTRDQEISSSVACSCKMSPVRVLLILRLNLEFAVSALGSKPSARVWFREVTELEVIYDEQILSD